MYDTYQQIAADTGSTAILEVPFGVRSGTDRLGAGDEALQFFQPMHGKNLAGGTATRVPDAVFEFYREHPSLRFLCGEVLPADAEMLDRDFASVLEWSGATYVLVHPAFMAASHYDIVLAFLHRKLRLERLADEVGLVAYRVR